MWINSPAILTLMDASRSKERESELEDNPLTVCRSRGEEEGGALWRESAECRLWAAAGLDDDDGAALFHAVGERVSPIHFRRRQSHPRRRLHLMGEEGLIALVGVAGTRQRREEGQAGRGRERGKHADDSKEEAV